MPQISKLKLRTYCVKSSTGGREGEGEEGGRARRPDLHPSARGKEFGVMGGLRDNLSSLDLHEPKVATIAFPRSRRRERLTELTQPSSQSSSKTSRSTERTRRVSFECRSSPHSQHSHRSTSSREFEWAYIFTPQGQYTLRSRFIFSRFAQIPDAKNHTTY